MTLYDLLKTHEGAGNPNTLFGHSQREGGRFSGVNVSEMNLGQLKDFTNPKGDYGRWVKDELGRIGHQPRVATPTGVGQIVGSTLRQVQEELGLGDDVLYDEKTQRTMINHLAGKRINVNDKAGTLKGLRQEWEGFNHVDDDTLWKAAMEFGDGTNIDPAQLNTGKGRLFKFQQDMQEGSGATRSVIERMASMGQEGLDTGEEGSEEDQLARALQAMSPDMGQMEAPPNEGVAPAAFSPPAQLDMGGGAPAADPVQEEQRQTLFDKIGEKLFPNQEDPGGKFKETLGAVGVGLGQMSAGQAVNLQPYFQSIADRKQASADAIERAQQQRIDNEIRMGTLANQTKQTDIASARLAHDMMKDGGSALDYGALATNYPELEHNGLIELAQGGNEEAQKEIIGYVGDRLADSSELSADAKGVLGDYLKAGDDVDARVAALAGLSPEDAQSVVDLAADIGGEEAAQDPAEWRLAEKLHKDLPDQYSSVGEAFKAIKKMEVTGGGIHPQLVDTNIKTGTELQLSLNERATEGEKTITTAEKAERAVKGVIKSGSGVGGGKQLIGKILGNVPFVGADAKNKFYDAIDFPAQEASELTQAQGDMLALIARDYEGQGEISDSERVEMAKRVISGDMDEVTMMSEIARMKADGAFKSGDARVFRSISNSGNLHSRHAEAQEKILDFSRDKRAVLARQRSAGQFRYYMADGAPDSEDKKQFDLDYRDENGNLNFKKYVENIAPPVSSEFAKHYKESLPIVKNKDGTLYHVYMTYDGEIKFLKQGRE